jgi:hypothetical protein
MAAKDKTRHDTTVDSTNAAAISSAAAAAALQLYEDLTFPLFERSQWERIRVELRDGFAPIVAETFGVRERETAGDRP